jgi:hypothetical protein
MRGMNRRTPGIFSAVTVIVASWGAVWGEAEAQAQSRTTGARAPSTSTTRAASGFAAFTWSHNQPPASPHVSGLVHIHPATNISDAAAQLRALPAGRRVVIIQGLTEELASHPSDQCVQRSWKLVTRKVPAPKESTASAKGLVAAPLRKASAGTRSARPTSNPEMVTITERVATDLPTGFRGPWMDKGLVAVRSRIDALMADLKRLGAEIECLAVDNETWLHAASFLGKEGALKAIEGDPRWPALASSMGLPSIVSDMSWGSEKYFLWTERMSGRFDAALNEAVFVPLRKHFPNASASQYMSSRLLGAVATPDLNGHLDRRSTAGFGTHENSEFYGWLAAGRISKTGGSSTDASWLALRVEVHKIRGMNASSSRPKHAWIAARSWQGETWGIVPFANTPVWDELVLQLGMHGVRQFFELVIEDYSISRKANLAKRVADRAFLEANLADLEARIGISVPSAPITLPQPSWNDRVIATGQRVGSRCIWRFSFAPGIRAVRVQLSDGSTKMVQREAGKCGAWFEHPSTTSLVTVSGSPLPTLEIVNETGPQTSVTMR